jgi:hypothetical protein
MSTTRILIQLRCTHGHCLEAREKFYAGDIAQIYTMSQEIDDFQRQLARMQVVAKPLCFVSDNLHCKILTIRQNSINN